MSITGEFQRYLEATLDRLDSLDQEAKKGTSDPRLATLREELEGARPAAATPISESADRVLNALNAHDWSASEQTPCLYPAHRLQETQLSARDLIEISRIILGRSD
ncbi:MAG: hypothetical protein P8Q97_11810 [Myxococcota bacterium]|jgi:hypothetical protein|nr:hypothetical protein [Myxococcota bacterium]